MLYYPIDSSQIMIADQWLQNWQKQDGVWGECVDICKRNGKQQSSMFALNTMIRYLLSFAISVVSSIPHFPPYQTQKRTLFLAICRVLFPLCKMVCFVGSSHSRWNIGSPFGECLFYHYSPLRGPKWFIPLPLFVVANGKCVLSFPELSFTASTGVQR